jgi:hypothetical protein
MVALMADPLIPPTPRSNIIGRVGSTTGQPVYGDRVWIDYWTRAILERLGGTNGMSISDLAAEVDAAFDEIGATAGLAALALAEARKERDDQTDHYLQLILARLEKLNRRVSDIEDRTL